MPARKKSKFESFFSLNQHRKRFGAGKISNQIEEVDLTAIKESILDGTSPTYTHGSDKNLTNHLENLQSEFSGQSELLYYHAKLIVLIRRDYKTKENFQRFCDLWDKECDFLLLHLNTRWLVSASDTYADHSDDSLEKSIALSVSLLINTIKLQETERFIESSKPIEGSDKKLAFLQDNRLALFDGTSAFTPGTDDTLRNMRWRLDSICKLPCTTGKILQEIFQRLQENETVYYRFKKIHSRQKTAWW